MDELCARPGVTPWDWHEGMVRWPPVTSAIVEPGASSTTCEVSLTEDRVSIRIEGPRQLEIGELLERAKAAYERALQPRGMVYAAPEARMEPSVAMERAATYGAPPVDAVLDAIMAGGDEGLTVGELVERTGWTKGRVQKRVRELKDASRVTSGRRRHAYVGVRDAAPASIQTPAVSTTDAESQTSLFRSR